MTEYEALRGQALREKTTDGRGVLSRELRKLRDDQTAFSDHVQGRTNPHRTDKEQLGLLYVEDYPLASDEEIAEGALSTRYVRPTQLPYAAQTHMPETTTNPYVGTPSIQSPMIDETDVGLNPSIRATGYTFSAPKGLTFARREYQIALVDEDWAQAAVTWSQTNDDASTPPIALDHEHWYRVRARDVVDSGESSDWSLPIVFQTRGVKSDPVTITHPTDGGSVALGGSIRWSEAEPPY